MDLGNFLEDNMLLMVIAISLDFPVPSLVHLHSKSVLHLYLLVVIYFAFDRCRFDVCIKIAKHILEYCSDNIQGPPSHYLEKEMMHYFWSECKNKRGCGKALE